MGDGFVKRTKAVRLNKHKDKLKKAHKKKAGHDDVEAPTERASADPPASGSGVGPRPAPGPCSRDAGVAPPRGFL